MFHAFEAVYLHDDRCDPRLERGTLHSNTICRFHCFVFSSSSCSSPRNTEFSKAKPTVSNWLHTLKHPFTSLGYLRKLDTVTLRRILLPNKQPQKLFPRVSAINMSDDAYSSFLDQANQDTGSKKVSTSSQGQKNPSKAVNTDVPPSLHSVQAVYTSDADEPFEPVSLQWDEKTIPDASEHRPLNHCRTSFGR